MYSCILHRLVDLLAIEFVDSITGRHLAMSSSSLDCFRLPLHAIVCPDVYANIKVLMFLKILIHRLRTKN